VSIEKPEQVSLNVYPNPSTFGSPVIIKIGNLDLQNAEIIIFNSKGQVIKRISNPETENEIFLPRGEFSGRLVLDREKLSFKMIVK
jgi:hypothetical protein